MAETRPEFQPPSFVGGDIVAVLRTRWNVDIVNMLHSSTEQRLQELGARVETLDVPGAYELPTAAAWAARSGRFVAVICCGCVIRGETPHFDYVAGNCASGLMKVGVETGVPTIFGVLTVNSEEQAIARAGGDHGNAGTEAANAAAEMVALKRSLRP